MSPLTEILASWQRDSKLDSNALDTSSLHIPSLHAKYLHIYSMYKSDKNTLQKELKSCERVLYSYFRGDLNNPADLAKLGREPFRQKLSKTADLTNMVETDEDYLNIKFKLQEIEDIIDATKEILNQINRMSFHIKNAIEVQKMELGDI